MRENKKTLKKLLPWGIMLTMLMTGCSDSDATEETRTDIFEAQTAIAYSSGEDGEWSYGNQRKEFPLTDACYARIASTIIADKSKDVDTEVTVTYRFTGVENCTIQLSDGKASEVKTSDDDTVEFTRVLYAQDEDEAAEDFAIFRYTTSSEASVVLEVIYDDFVAEKFDDRNTMYFTADGTALAIGTH
ncbi:hypothetical protein RFF05_12860 [Bengtsoniella intestinalis]|uniref:hypothetical protein n=1 Tax=Bengtsoniella intestinalis TaxID=3073143 RepID=UPI00391F0F8C